MLIDPNEDISYGWELYREPVLRAWKPEEGRSLIGLTLISKGNRDCARMITGFTGNSFCLGGGKNSSPEELLSNWTRSDGSPCGAMEDVK